MDGNRKGYKKVISEESGSTEQGRKTVVATYRPSLGLSKVVERDIEYRTATSPRNRSTIKETTKRYNDGSVKSYKNIVKQNGSIVPEVTTPKVKYRKGEKPFGKKIGANMKGDPVKDKGLRNKLLRIKGGNQLDTYDLERKEYVKKTGYLPPRHVKSITDSKLSNEVVNGKPKSINKTTRYSHSTEIITPPTTRNMGVRREMYSIIGGNDKDRSYSPGVKEYQGRESVMKEVQDRFSKENKIKGANMKGVPHYKKDGTEYKGATHKSGKQLMSGKTHTSSSVNLFHKDEIPGPSMQGSWMRKHVKG